MFLTDGTTEHPEEKNDPAATIKSSKSFFMGETLFLPYGLQRKGMLRQSQPLKSGDAAWVSLLSWA